MIKKIILLLFLLILVSSIADAGLKLIDGPLGVGTRAKPDSSAIMQIRSTTKGFKVPEMTTAQRDAIVSPAIGLEIFNSTSGQKEIFDGIVWTSIGTGNSFFRVTQAAHGRTVGFTFIPVYLTGGIWTDAKADAQASLGTHVIVQVLDANTFTVAQSGRYTITGHGLVVETHYFVSETVGGTVQILEPPVYSNPILFVEDANIIHVMPFRAFSFTGSASPGSVVSVFGRAGSVVAVAGDYTASLVTNVPAGDIAAIEVQSAINELDTEKQPINTELIGLSGLATTGIVARTGAGTYSTRTLQAGSTKVTLVNPDGVAGNPSIDIDQTQIDHDLLLNFLSAEHIDWTSTTQNFLTTGTLASGNQTVTGNVSVTGIVDGRDLSVDGTKLDGVESLADVTDTVNVAASGAVMDIDFAVDGLMVRTALGSYTNRSLIAGSTKVAIANGDGIAGNPSIDVDQTQMDHDLLLNFVADEHIAHSAVSIDVSATNDGISGGGDLTATRNLLIDINTLAPEGVLAGIDEFMMYDLSANDLKKVTVATLSAFFGGEANTASNLGVGEGVFTAKLGVNFPFKSFIGGTNVTLSSDANEITIDVPTAEANTASNLAGGFGVFESKVALDLRFKSLVAGTNMGIISAANTLTLNATGEANTGSSLGGTEAIFAGKVLQDLTHKGLTAGAGITLTPTATDVTIASVQEFMISGGINNASLNITKPASMGANTANGGFTALKDGEIFGISVRINNTWTGGTLTASSLINGIVQNGAGEETTIDAANTQGNFQVIAAPISFNAGDNIAMQSLTVGFTSTGADVVIVLWLRDR